ncbi:MAG: hypothetical protein WBA61_14165 [Aequorivita sp.]
MSTKNDSKDENNGPQQQPEDPKKQNAQQEREWREQQKGKLKNPPKQPTDVDAREKYKEIDSKIKKGNLEEE